MLCYSYMFPISPSPSLSIFTVPYFIVPQMQKNNYITSLGEIPRGRVIFFFLIGMGLKIQDSVPSCVTETCWPQAIALVPSV